LSGSHDGRAKATLARANSNLTSHDVLGLTTSSIEVDAEGMITAFGLVRNLDTSAFTAGDTIYLSATDAGELTATAPSYPNYVVNLGVVISAHATTGSVLVHTEEAQPLLDQIINKLSLQGASTGLTSFINGGLTITPGSGTENFSVGEIKGWFIDNTTDAENPTITHAHFDAIPNIVATYRTTHNVTYVAINSEGAVQQSTTPWTTVQERSLIVLGLVGHPNKSTLSGLNNQPQITLGAVHQLRDFAGAVGFFNKSGNKITANGANLFITKSAGESIFRMGSNAGNSLLSPHVVEVAARNSVSTTFRYRLRAGKDIETTNVIFPSIWDDGSDVDAAQVVDAGKWTIQRISMFPSGSVIIQPGQAQYTTLDNAKAAVSSEIFIVDVNISENALLRAFLIIKAGETDLTSANTFLIEADKFGSSLGVGSPGAATLQGSYDNATSSEILTDTTRGGIVLRRGSAADSDNIFTGKKNDGTTTFAVKGTGVVNAVDLILSGDLTVSGTTTTANSETLTITDKHVVLGAIAPDNVSATGTIGTVSGAGPYTATITDMASTSGLIVGEVITATDGTGSLGVGVVTIVTIVDGTSITVSSTLTFTAGTITDIFSSRPTDITADGGGVILKSAINKTLLWVDATDSWTSSDHLDLASGKVLKVAGTQILSPTQYTGNAATVTNGVYTSSTLAALASTTSDQLRGVITNETGTGALVFGTSPAFITPDLGVATATTINATSIPTSKTLVVTTDTLAALASTTPSELRDVISDDTGTGALVFADSPTLIGIPLAPTAALNTNTTQIATTQFVMSNAGSTKLYNQSVSTPGTGFTAAVYLVGSGIANVTLPIVGTRYHCLFDVSKTAAGVGVPVVTVRYGTNGSTADTARLTFTFALGTAVLDTGMFEVWVTFRTVGSGTSAVMTGVCRAVHDGNTTGILGLSEVVTLVQTSAGFDSTVANSIIGVTVTGGALAAWTISMVQSTYENF